MSSVTSEPQPICRNWAKRKHPEISVLEPSSRYLNDPIKCSCQQHEANKVRAKLNISCSFAQKLAVLPDSE